MEERYSYYDSIYANTYSRRCVDGSIAGCSKCVGYCEYAGHAGFLTEKQRKAHGCIEKGCFYYHPKPKSERVKKIESSLSSELKNYISEIMSKFEGMRPMHIEVDSAGECLIKYITISNAYPISTIEQEISGLLGRTIRMVKLNYDFDRVVQLLLA